MSAAPHSTMDLVEVRPVRRSPLRRVARRGVRVWRAWRWRRRLAAFGARSVIDPPAWVLGAESIAIGRDVHVWRDARLAAHNAERGCVRIDIGDGCALHPSAHVSAVTLVKIGAHALLAANVYVTDHDHDIADPDQPPIANRRVVTAPTRIGPATWLGERVIVLKGVTIGAHTTVGAGSIVTRDLPPYAVAVGAPARVVRTYDPATRRWRDARLEGRAA